MKFIAISTLFLMFAGVSAAEEAPAARAPAQAASPTGPDGQAPAPTNEALQQAFDGAMTCSALTAVKSSQADASEAWRWGNRSFAFGMLAVRFYTDATQQQLENEEVNNMLTDYANTLVAMTPEQRQPFEEGCARKYAEIDKLCELNACPRSPPGIEGTPAPSKPAPDTAR